MGKGWSVPLLRQLCRGIQSIKNRIPLNSSTQPNEGLKSPGRKCCHEGNKFSEGKQQSEGNKVLLSVLQHLHQQQTLVALIASPWECLGLSFLEEKHRNLVLLPFLKANGAA